MTDSPRFSDAPQRLEELTAVLAEGGGGAVRGDHRFDDRVVYHLGRRNYSRHHRGGGDPGRRTRQTKHGGLGPTGRTRGRAAVPVRLRALSDRVARPGDGPGSTTSTGRPGGRKDGRGR